MHDDDDPLTYVDAAGQERVSVLVYMDRSRADHANERAVVRRAAANAGGIVKYEYKTVMPNVLNLRDIPSRVLPQIRNLPGVTRVEKDEYHPHLVRLDESTPRIRAMQSQISGAGLSADGAGIRVCIADTGIDMDHIMYADRIDADASWDFNNNDPNPDDDHGHGSHVAGIAVGGTGLVVNFEPPVCDGDEPFQGVAPAATLIGAKILNQNGGGSDSNIIAGIDHCADQSASGGRADVINLSIGTGNFAGTCDTHAWAIAANNAVANGVVVVAASGNEGNSNSMGSPACASDVIAVGATYKADYPRCEDTQDSFTWCLDFFCFSSCTDNSPAGDDLVCFSNQSDLLDVAAPGSVIWSASNDPGGGTIMTMSGTSQASPHVAGLAALILSADPTLTPGEVRQIIRDGAIDMGPAGFDRGYGYGRIDAINSLQLIGPSCTTDGDCDDGLFCNGAETCDTGTGACQPGTPPNCDDGVSCTDDSCNESTDSCDNIANDANCDNGLFCDGAETCDPVLDCQAGTAPDCSDSVTCTDDSCNESTDSCDNIANDANCSNGIFCDGAETCDPALDCQPGTPPSCDDGVGCTDDSCNTVTDSCDNIANDANCDNGLFCDGLETCDPVLDCQGGTAPDCSDGVTCTDDSCNEATDSCDNVANDANCDNGLFCDGTETCDPALDCQAGIAPDCNDGVACTDDSCNEATDSCDNIANDANCDNGLFCDGAETCDPALGCLTGTAPDCDDGVNCTDDSCNESTDSCDNIADDLNCDNGLFCDGAETCDPVLDCQAGTAPECSDGIGCTDDSCNESTDSCDNIANDANCDNGAFCDGAEFCDPALDCQAGADPCPGESCDEVNDVCVPLLCDDDGTCEAGEDCNNCPNDCFSGSGASCGNGICEAADGEDCLSCPSDCNGLQTGKPTNRFCCGDGEGDGGIICDSTTPECNGGGFACTDVPALPSCCGDGICEGTEDGSNCAVDCACVTDADCDDGVACTNDACVGGFCDNTANDANCADDGLFCNGTEYCDTIAGCSSTGDPCSASGVCNETTDTCDPCTPKNDSCSSDSECCSGICKSNGRCR